MSSKPLSVRCPACQRAVPWTDASPFKPFCSERCKLMDLGGWASGQHRIPDEETPFSPPVDEESTRH